MGFFFTHQAPCVHERTQLAHRVIRGGGIQLVKQCVDCGELTEGPLPHSRVRCVTALPLFDLALRDQQRARRRHRKEITT